MKRLLTSVIFLVVLVAAVVMVRTVQADPSTDGTVIGTAVLGRLAQEAGTVGTVAWPSNGATGISIGEETDLPEGMTARVSDSGEVVVIDCNALTPGTFTATFVLRARIETSLTDWSGQPIERTQVGVIIWHVYPREDAPFMSGLGDILVTPIPSAGT